MDKVRREGRRGRGRGKERGKCMRVGNGGRKVRRGRKVGGKRNGKRQQ